MSGAAVDFREFPKQFLLWPEGAPAPRVAGGHAETAAGWHVAAAPATPLIPIRDAEGDRIGLLIGWAMVRGRLHGQGDVVALGDGETVEDALLPDLAGRAVCLWRDARGAWLQTDAGGALPAVWSAEAGLIASTSLLIDLLAPCGVDADAAALFEFPRRKGFLPFGLTHHRGVRRLLPGHRLDLGAMTAARVWPAPTAGAAPMADEAEGDALIRAIADRVRSQVGAVAQAAPPRLYLSGGHDSRMILAALRDHAAALTCETIVNDAALDLHLAARVARFAGARHVAVPRKPMTSSEIEAWVRRTGWSFCDALTELGATAVAEDRRQLVMDGTGAEILRASNWIAADLEADALPPDLLLARIRVPETALTRAEAEAWLAALPKGDRTFGLDVAKIDMIHGCWSGASVYGHDIEVPSISPFASQRNYADALRVPNAWRLSGETYRRWMAHLWPEGLSMPVNRAKGFERLMFPKSELKRLVPSALKRRLKPFR